MAGQRQPPTYGMHLEHREGIAPSLFYVVDVGGELVGHLLQQECSVVFVVVQKFDKLAGHLGLERLVDIL